VQMRQTDEASPMGQRFGETLGGEADQGSEVTGLGGRLELTRGAADRRDVGHRRGVASPPAEARRRGVALQLGVEQVTQKHRTREGRRLQAAPHPPMLRAQTAPGAPIVAQVDVIDAVPEHPSEVLPRRPGGRDADGASRFGQRGDDRVLVLRLQISAASSSMGVAASALETGQPTFAAAACSAKAAASMPGTSARQWSSILVIAAPLSSRPR
jgi:hypothetical protein